MRKNIIFMVLISTIILALIVLVSCDKEKNIVIDSTSNENPFDENKNTKILGKQSHGFVKPLNEDDYFTYSGQEMEIEYYVELEGVSNNIGFLLYVNGEPQPYKIKNRTTEYAYLHAFNVNNGRESFTFQFDVISGHESEILDLAIVSIYNPEFKPDMKETTSYSMYHSALPTVVDRLKMAINPTQKNRQLCAYGKGVKSLKNETFTISEAFWNTEVKKNYNITMEALDDQSIAFIRFNGVEQFGAIKMSDSESLTIEYYMAGVPEAEYVTTFYLDHKPIESVGHKLEKGKVNQLKLNLNISDLENLNTFYVISVPKHEKQYLEKLVVIDKTASYMLYKESFDTDSIKVDPAKSTLLETFSFIGIDEKIDSVEYGDANHLIVGTNEHIYLYDWRGVRIEQKINLDASTVKDMQIKTIADGYAMVIKKKLDGGSEFICRFYDKHFEYKSELILSDIINNEMLVSLDNITISSLGDKIAIATMSNVYLYDVVSGQNRKILALSDDHYEKRRGIATMSELNFTKDGNHLLFLANSFNVPVKLEDTTHRTYGYLTLEGALQENKSVSNYLIQDMLVYEEHALLTEFEIDSNGKVVVLDLEKKKERLYDTNSEAKMGKSIFGSDGGKYFSAVERNEKKGVADISIYSVDDGSLITKKHLSNLEESITGLKVYVNDALKLCLIVYGNYDTIYKFHF